MPSAASTAMTPSASFLRNSGKIMITRIALSNYKCFSDVEINLQSLHLFLGHNGSGKTSLLKLLTSLKMMLVSEKEITELFGGTLPKWDITQNFQLLDITIILNNLRYHYMLTIEHNFEIDKLRISSEVLFCENKKLIETKLGEVTLYRDDYSQGPTFPTSWGRSIISTIPERKDHTRLTCFRDWFRDLQIVSINPFDIYSETEESSSYLESNCQNFVSWFDYLSDDLGAMEELQKLLRDILTGFTSFKWEKTSSKSKKLVLRFNCGDISSLSDFTINELSDGQRCLLILYTCLYFHKKISFLGFDEPDNYLALPEIQPWITEIKDKCDSQGMQSIIISHHPESLNYLSIEHGLWFERKNNGSSRIRRFEISNDQPLTVAEYITRGWG